MSIIIGKALIAGGGTAKRLEFEYTGTYNERLDDGVVELLTSGVLTFKKETVIDVFMVGGGASGGNFAKAGGSGGYTKTSFNIIPRKNQSYSIVIGAGGAEQTTLSATGNPGGVTTAFGIQAEGGTSSAGGSGGGSGGQDTTSGQRFKGAPGGADGSDGGLLDGYSTGNGKGQGTTTREFGEPTGKLYSGGGGGGATGSYVVSSPVNFGGEGGGGNGGYPYDPGKYKNAEPGTPNTGGGGGGGIGKSDYDTYPHYGAAGGSGIVCIRLHKESA